MPHAAIITKKAQAAQGQESRWEIPAYRADIDGLRAVAILGVLLFHCQLGARGGFAGVDVFFVISGFLITGIILKDWDADMFSLKKFWERRIRRIIPALAVVIFATIAAGWMLLLPLDFQGLGNSVIAQAVFSANFFFYSQGGYFDPSISSNPLLHTWSLAVEEQYYLLYPLLFLLIRSKKILYVAVCSIFGLSLILSVFLTYTAQSAAYYFLPTRAWELAAGALIVLFGNKIVTSTFNRNLFGIIGLSFILIAYAFYTQKTLFPGYAAVLPCVGSGMLIWAGADQGTIIARLLGLRALVFIGQISYSLYLWHWPIVTYAKYEVGPHRWPIRISWILLSVLLATITWKCVETPFRQKKVFRSQRALFAFGVSVPVMIAVCGVILSLSLGIPGRYSEQALKYASGATDFPYTVENSSSDVLSGRLTTVAPISDGRTNQSTYLLVWGDSHAMAIMPAIEVLAKRHMTKVVAVTRSGTPPILLTKVDQDHLPPDYKPVYNQAESIGKAVVRYVADHHVANVLLAANWDVTEDDTTNFSQVIQNTVKELQGTGTIVWIMKDVPIQRVDIPKLLALDFEHGRRDKLKGISIAEHRVVTGVEDEIFDGARDKGAIILDPTPYFFTNTDFCMVELNGRSLYRDNNHLSSYGSMVLLPLLDKIWRPMTASNVIF